ncbi:hypothetical protein EII18_02205 [Comamonadaceae bacterium OH3737_COT-264]|nr:hypothetical protein EII18_02205 [Comamonadaceae bacterium OH3737_COT-264]
MMPATVTEVVYRAEQGKTRPYLCQADDGLRYFVKHRSLPRRELVAEWLAAWLARALGLPIAPFRLIEIPDALAGLPWLRELGPGVGFGSALQPAREFSLHDVRRLPSGLAARVAAFDWWVRNSDRSLSAHGGNENTMNTMNTTTPQPECAWRQPQSAVAHRRACRRREPAHDRSQPGVRARLFP